MRSLRKLAPVLVFLHTTAMPGVAADLQTLKAAKKKGQEILEASPNIGKLSLPAGAASMEGSFSYACYWSDNPGEPAEAGDGFFKLEIDETGAVVGSLRTRCTLDPGPDDVYGPEDCGVGLKEWKVRPEQINVKGEVRNGRLVGTFQSFFGALSLTGSVERGGDKSWIGDGEINGGSPWGPGFSVDCSGKWRTEP